MRLVISAALFVAFVWGAIIVLRKVNAPGVAA